MKAIIRKGFNFVMGWILLFTVCSLIPTAGVLVLFRIVPRVQQIHPFAEVKSHPLRGGTFLFGKVRRVPLGAEESQRVAAGLRGEGAFQEDDFLIQPER